MSDDDIPWPTVLVVDDDPVTLGIVAEALADRFTVIVAANERQARAAAESAERVDVLISDVNVPGAGGRQLAALIGALHPSARVIYISGFSREQLAEHGIVTDSRTFLAKPFALDELRAAVSRAVGR